MVHSISILFVPTLWILASVTTIHCIYCKDEDGSSVDWFITYKPPAIENVSYNMTDPFTDMVKQGTAYVYIDSKAIENSGLTFSAIPITSSASALGKTLSQLYDRRNNQDLTYLFYNDNTPCSMENPRGFAKGLLLFDRDEGIWMVHSIPRFPSLDTFEFPQKELPFGHMTFCVTLRDEQINSIGKQLLLIQPLIYASRLDANLKHKIDEDVQTLFTTTPTWTRLMDSREVILESDAKAMLKSFAKGYLFGKDLYSDVISLGLRTDIQVQTWRSQKSLLSHCEKRFFTENVKTLEMLLSVNDILVNVPYESWFSDRSRWAVSTSNQRPWFCVGDLSRIEVHMKRGGGALCIQSENVQKVFLGFVNEFEACSVMTKKNNETMTDE